MNQIMSFTQEWLEGGIWGWTLLSVLVVVLLVVAVVKLANEES